MRAGTLEWCLETLMRESEKDNGKLLVVLTKYKVRLKTLEDKMCGAFH